MVCDDASADNRHNWVYRSTAFIPATSDCLDPADESLESGVARNMRLDVNRFNVGVDRVIGDAEVPGDLRVGHAIGEEQSNIRLGRRQGEATAKLGAEVATARAS